MKVVVVLPPIIGCLLDLTNHSQDAVKDEPPLRYTIVVHYESCTECADFSVDSGEVVVPTPLRKAFIEARYQRLKRYKTRKQVAQALAVGGYRVSFLRAATEAAYDSLFTPPWRTSHDPIPENEDRSIQSGYWQRVYRLTGTVAGFDGRYLKFKVQKAVLLPDKLAYSTEK